MDILVNKLMYAGLRGLKFSNGPTFKTKSHDRKSFKKSKILHLPGVMTWFYQSRLHMVWTILYPGSLDEKHVYDSRMSIPDHYTKMNF